jgi:hypothetical protein
MNNELRRLHFTVRKKIYPKGWTDAVNMIQDYHEFYKKCWMNMKEFRTKIKLDHCRYGKPKDSKPVRCEKVLFEIIKSEEGAAKKIADHILEQHEKESYERLYQIQKEIKGSKVLLEKKMCQAIKKLEENYYKEAPKEENLNPNQISQESQKKVNQPG